MKLNFVFNFLKKIFFYFLLFAGIILSTSHLGDNYMGISDEERSDYLILGAAFLSFLFSVSLWFSGQQQEGLYVGIWVPSILAAGAYVKQIFRK